jgi:dipeptidyl aminopeptidase/acylaminoacyl peptidase
MRAEDLLHFEWIADPHLSPDGTRIAFTRVHVDREADEYRTAIWIADARDGADPAPRALTQGPSDGQPRWSPDGTRLAFIRKPAGGDPEAAPQLCVLPMDGGEASVLTSLKKGASHPAWSPDGMRIAFISTTNPALDDDPERKKPKHEPGRLVTRPVFRWNDQGFMDHDHPSHVWVIEAAGGAPRRLTAGEHPVQAPSWSRDGRWIYFLADRRAEPWFEHDEQKLYAVSPDLAAPTDGAEMRVVAEVRGPILAYAEAADGRIIATGDLRGTTFRSHEPTRLLLFEGAWPRTAGAALTAHVDLDFNDGVSGDQHAPRGGGAPPLTFAADGRHVHAVVVRHGAAMLARVALANGAVEELTGTDTEVSAGSANADGTRFALVVGSADSPGDLCLYDTASGRLRHLWRPNAARIEAARLGEVEAFWCDSFDGTKIQGWIVKPPDFDPGRKYPLILQIHGGPHVPYGVAFFHEFRVLAAAGYVVLYTNPRGSTSYGLEFANTIQYRYPGDDYRDLMAAVDHVVARGYVDDSRLGVTGGSGGGLLTNWTIGHTDRFAAAITDRCVSDWSSMWFSSDFPLFTPSWFRRAPYEDPQEFLERSPMRLLAKIRTPLLVVHSEEDWRTPIAQGEVMFRGLKAQRKPVAMVRFPGENHELSRSGTPSRRVQRLEHAVRWFGHWLMDRPAPEYGVPAAAAATAAATLTP